MPTKRINPYTALQKAARDWARTVSFARKLSMWHYENGKTYSLDDLRERVAAADQLGYNVTLSRTDTGLQVHYVKRPPDAPWEIRP